MSDPVSPVDDEASSWFAKHSGGLLSNADQRAFESWYQDPVNAGTYDELARLFESLDQFSADPTVMAARKSALNRSRRRFRIFAVTGIAASIAIAIGVASSNGLPWFGGPKAAAQEEVFETQIGQGATVLLADQTHVTLDADTEMAIAFDDKHRRVVLKRGRILCEVAKDAGRPFVVRTPMGSVRAVGTDFSVGTRAAELEVVLREGSVRVFLGRSDSRQDPIDMKAGTKLTASTAGWTLSTVAGDSATAWTRGFVVLDNVLLRNAVAEMNSYAHRKIVLAPELGNVPISGTFRAGRQQDFAKALEAYGVARIDHITTTEIALAPK